jgi:hypothetical protein
MAQAFRSVATVTNNIGNTLTISKPAGVVDGDLLVFGAITNDPAAIFATLSGWTQLHSAQPNSQWDHQVFYKVASGEPASYVWTASGTSPRSCGVMGAVSGARATVDVQSLTFTASGGNIVITDITTTQPNQMLFWIASRTDNTNNIIPPPNLTNRGGNVNTGGTTGTPQLNFACEIFPTAGITSTAWSRGSFSSGTGRAEVSFFAMLDAVPVSAARPLLFCEA